MDKQIVHMGMVNFFNTQFHTAICNCEGVRHIALCRTTCEKCSHVGTDTFAQVSCLDCLGLMARVVELECGTPLGIILDKLQEDGFGNKGTDSFFEKVQEQV